MPPTPLPHKMFLRVPAIMRPGLSPLRSARSAATKSQPRAFSTCAPLWNASRIPTDDATAPPPPPSADKASSDTAFLGTTKRLPEFSLKNKVVLVSGAARGLGLVQAEALLEAGATGMNKFRSEEACHSACGCWCRC